MYLRCYRETDFEALYQLDLACFPEPFRFSRRVLRSVLRTRGAVVRLACQWNLQGKEEIKGFCIATVQPRGQHPVGYIATLDVSASSRRQGVAQVLMTAVEEALARVVNSVDLHVYTGNDDALRLYDRLGYRRLEIIENFYGPQLNAWVCRKFLLPPG